MNIFQILSFLISVLFGGALAYKGMGPMNIWFWIFLFLYTAESFFTVIGNHV